MSNTARKYREAADLFGDSQRNTAHLRLLHGDMSGDATPATEAVPTVHAKSDANGDEYVSTLPPRTRHRYDDDLKTLTDCLEWRRVHCPDDTDYNTWLENEIAYCKKKLGVL